MSRSSRIVAASVAVFLSIGWAARGQTIVYVDDDAVGANDGSTWCDAFNHLQDALADAAASGGTVTEIHVAQGIYKPDEGANQTLGNRSATFQLVDGVALRGGYAGCGAPDPDARDCLLYETTLSGDLNGDDWPDFWNNDENSHHVVTASGTTGLTILDGVVIKGGNTEGEGGGIYNTDGSPTIHNCRITQNYAFDGGGGMYSVYGSPTVTNCVFHGNRTWRGGGAVFNDYSSNALFIRCVFSGNTATSVYDPGGAMRIDYSDPTIINCQFTGNFATHGNAGAVHVEDASPVFLNSVFHGNSADHYVGGLSNEYGSPVVTNCIFWNNRDAGGVDESAQIGPYGVTVTYSCIEGLNALSGNGNIGLDPLFVDPNGPDGDAGTWQDNDFHLAPASPCINAGNNDAPAMPGQDFEGDARIQHCRVDMGVDETPHYFDCNENATADVCDIEAGTSEDCTNNRIPDECEPDCNGNTVADSCDIDDGTSDDCTSNGVPDECEPDCNSNEVADSCDVAGGSSDDCNGNVVPDECEPDEDCNTNGFRDICDISAGISIDCNDNLVPDECDISAGMSEDCAGEGIPDECEPDCNGNGTADSCDIVNETSEDCTGNGVPDECEPDCNDNGIADSCDINGPTSTDCNTNGVPDECDVAAGLSEDANANGLLDECEGACCIGTVCTDMTADDCEAADGFYAPGLLCPPINPSNRCLTGACCTNPLNMDCDDDYTVDQCDSAGGVYYGGASCGNYVCLACPIESADNCKTFGYPRSRVLSDRYVNVRVADDFRPTTSVISHVCWMPFLMGPNGEDCTYSGPPGEDWLISIYPDDGTGVPDDDNPVVFQAPITIEAKVCPAHCCRPDPGRGGLCVYLCDYSGSFDPVTVVPGECYWIEILGRGSETCRVYMTTGGEGNRHSMFDIANYGDYEPTDQRSEDFFFCVDSGISGSTDCGDRYGVCCTCPGECMPWQTRAVCDDQSPPGGFILGETCASSPCPGIPANDDCENAQTISGLVDAGSEGITIDFNNICATDEGPQLGCGGGDLHFDIWYHYTAEAPSCLTATMCNLASFDTILAFYDGTGGPSAVCPVSHLDELDGCNTGSGDCCGDDTCNITSGPGEVSMVLSPGDEILIRLGGWYDAGQGVGDGKGWGQINFSLVPCPQALSAPAPEVGGPACATGTRYCHGGDLHGESCSTDADCIPPEGAFGDCWPDCWGDWSGADCVAGTCYTPRNRYLSVDPTVNWWFEVAYRVELIASSPYADAVGRQWFLDVPVCYDYPNGAPVPGATTCEGPDRFGWVSHLTDTPVYRVWTEQPLHVTGCGIVPEATYEIRPRYVLDSEWLDPLVIATAHRPNSDSQSWGDITGGPGSVPPMWLPPDRVTNFADVGNAIRTFENRMEDTGFPPRVWVDLEIDQVINLADVSFVVMAFEGLQYTDLDLPLIGTHPAECP